MSLGLTNNQPATNGFSLGASAYPAPAIQAPPTIGQSSVLAYWAVRVSILNT